MTKEIVSVKHTDFITQSVSGGKRDETCVEWAAGYWCLGASPCWYAQWKRTAHVKCRWITEASLSPNPFSHARISESLICHIAHLLVFIHIDMYPQLFSSIFLLHFFSFFPYASCSESAVALIVMGRVAHLASPGREVPCPASSSSSTTAPHHFFPFLKSWVDRDLTLAFVGASWKNKTDTKPKQWGEVCLSSLSCAGVRNAPAQGLLSTKLQHSIYQLSINHSQIWLPLT